jgi:hypothetical protein
MTWLWLCEVIYDDAVPALVVAAMSNAPGGVSCPGRRRRSSCQVVQAVPLTENAVGVASLVVQVPWKPREVLPPAAMAAL